MKIYLDIVYLINVYLGLLCLLSIGILENQHYKWQKILLISLVWGFVVISIYLKQIYLVFFIWCLVISLLIDKKQFLKIFLIWIFLYFTYTTSFFYFESEVMRYGPILLVGTSFQWIYALLLGTVLVVLYLGMSFYLKKDILKQGLYYPIHLKYENKVYSCIGFMDTGNQVVMDGFPVIFTSFPFLKQHEFVIQRIDGGKIVQAIQMEVYFQGSWQSVYLGYMKDLQLKEADVLLNLELL